MKTIWKQEPKNGARKTERCFALFPETINYNNRVETRWMEWITVEYEYTTSEWGNMWHARRFIDEPISHVCSHCGAVLDKEWKYCPYGCNPDQ